MEFIIEISARHVHLTQEDFTVLFGAESVLTLKKALSQPGEFLSNERVNIITENGRMDNVAILGPFRKKSQVEMSLTDCRKLGVRQPIIRESGNLEGSSPVSIEGPKGTVHLQEGLIVAKRHIHMTPADAERFQVRDKQIVRVDAKGIRPLIFDDVVVRVSDKYALAMHIDTDEANAAGIFTEINGRIV